jgi:uncharacterized membrane protein YkvA (DUF1232 family)
MAALEYFVEENDLIPDSIPGLGLLDDDIMIELVVRELRHEIEAYEDFCRFRDERSRRDPGDDADILARRRRALHERMRRRGQRRRRQAATSWPGLF